MRTLKAVFVALVFLLLPAFSQAQGLGNMRVSYIEGDVQAKTPDADDWGPASINGPLMEGDQVWVPEGGRVELQLNFGTYIRLDQGSALQVLSLDKGTAQFNVSQGHAYVYYKAPKGSVIQIDTPDVSVRAFDRGVFRVDMSDEYQYTDVSVYKGYVEAENQVGRTRVDADQTVSIGRPAVLAMLWMAAAMIALRYPFRRSALRSSLRPGQSSFPISSSTSGTCRRQCSSPSAAWIGLPTQSMTG